MNGTKKEIYRYIKGFQKKKPMVLFALPLAVYLVYRFWYRFIHGRIGLRVNKFVVTVVCALFLVSLVIAVINIIDMRRLYSRIAAMNDSEQKLLEEDFRFGMAFLDREFILGRKYIIAKGSMRLFSYDELVSVFDDIRETQSVFSMVITGSDDVVKTKIIKAEYKSEYKHMGFLNCRRMCAVSVHKMYSSEIGQTNGYKQIEAIEKEILGRLGGA